MTRARRSTDKASLPEAFKPQGVGLDFRFGSKVVLGILAQSGP